MLRCDLPDSPIASYRPDISAGIDKLPDFIREEAAKFEGSLPQTVAELADAIFSAVAAANLIEVEKAIAGAQGTSNPQSLDVVVKLLQLMSRDTDQHYRMRALCYLRLMGMEGRSFRALSEELGCERATVHRCYRELQKRLGDIPGRGDKSPEAREKYRTLRTGARRERGLCHFSVFWTAPQQLQLPLPAAPCPAEGGLNVVQAEPYRVGAGGCPGQGASGLLPVTAAA